MFVFNEERLKYLLEKIKLLLDEKINKGQIAVKPAVQGTAGLTVIAAGVTPSGSQIALDDPRIKDNVQVGDIVVLVDGVLSEENLTRPEKDILEDLVANGGLIKFLKQRMDCDGLEIITNNDYQFRQVDATNPLLESILYIINDGPVTALLLEGYAKQEDVDLLNENKQDKEIGTIQAGTSFTIISADLIPSDNEIAADDPRIKHFIDNNTVSIGDTVDLTYKVLTEENYTEEYDKALESLKGKDILLKSYVIDNLESNNGEVPLSANQGKVLKEEYLDSIKYKYINEADFNDDIDNDEINYHISDAPVAYGLDAEQVEMLSAAYAHIFIDNDSKYAQKSEISMAKVNNKGQSFNSLAERLIDIDNKLQTLLDFYN